MQKRQPLEGSVVMKAAMEALEAMVVLEAVEGVKAPGFLLCAFS